MQAGIKVTAFWDDEAHVWVAGSQDVLGLATEAVSLEELIRKLELMIPELLELNHGNSSEYRTGSFELITTLPLQPSG